MTSRDARRLTVTHPAGAVPPNAVAARAALESRSLEIAREALAAKALVGQLTRWPTGGKRRQGGPIAPPGQEPPHRGARAAV